jgi:hypothetical protein
MTIRHAIWKVGAKPVALLSSSLMSEQQLEEMIVAPDTIRTCDLCLRALLLTQPALCYPLPRPGQSALRLMS